MHINNKIRIIKNCKLSVKIDALNPPYKVYINVVVITNVAVNHNGVPEI